MPLSLDDRLRNFKAARPAPAAPAALLADLLGGEEIPAPGGTYYQIRRQYAGRVELPSCRPDHLRRNLRLLHGVGPRTEEKLRQMGIESLDQLVGHERWSDRAREVLGAIASCDLRRLKRSGARDLDLLSFFAPEEMVFIDIETTGLYSVLPLFLVGLLFQAGGELRLVQFLARRFEEEGPLLVAVAEELERFKMIVSYNGLAFDVPYLSGRFVAHRLPYRLNQAHVDLLHHARRKFRGRLPDCRLCTIEAEVLAQPRAEDIPGYMIPELYHQFVKTQDQAIIRGIVEHNAADLLALARLIRLVE